MMMCHQWPAAAVLALSLMIQACQHASGIDSKVASHLKARRCEEALRQVSDNYRTTFAEDVKSYGGTAASYAVQGAAATADVAVVIVGDVALFALYCSPALIAMATRSSMSQGCLGSGPLRSLDDPQWRKKADESTSAWRATDQTRLSQSMRRVVSCYEDRGQADDVRKAYLQIDMVKNGPLYANSDQEEQGLVDTQWARLKDRMQRDNPAYFAKPPEDETLFDTAAGLLSYPVYWQDKEAKTVFMLLPDTMKWSMMADACAAVDPKKTWRVPTRTEVITAIKHDMLAHDSTLGRLLSQEIKVFAADEPTILELSRVEFHAAVGNERVHVFCRKQ